LQLLGLSLITKNSLPPEPFVLTYSRGHVARRRHLPRSRHRPRPDLAHPPDPPAPGPHLPSPAPLRRHDGRLRAQVRRQGLVPRAPRVRARAPLRQVPGPRKRLHHGAYVSLCSPPVLELSFSYHILRRLFGDVLLPQIRAIPDVPNVALPLCLLFCLLISVWIGG
jgi:hypothetical protein